VNSLWRFPLVFFGIPVTVVLLFAYPAVGLIALLIMAVSFAGGDDSV
jgi:hypothetical protein